MTLPEICEHLFVRARTVRGVTERHAPAKGRRVASPGDEGHAPRRHRARAPRRRHRRRCRCGDRPGPGEGGARRQAGRRGARSRPPADRGHRDRDHHRALRAGRPRPDPPRHRARARRGRARALPGREDLDRAADRERLLLRLRVPRGRALLRERLPRARGEDEGAHRRRRAVRPRGRLRARGARALQGRGPALQGRADRGPRGRLRQPLHQRPVHRSLPRAARAGHQAHRRVQAAVDRRRLLARGLRPHDAHARLWDRVLQEEGPRPAPRAPRAGPRPRPPQARARARPVPVLRRRARQRVLAARRDDRVQRARAPLPRHGRAARLHRGQDAADLRLGAVEDLRSLGQVPARTCSSPVPRTASSASSR